MKATILKSGKGWILKFEDGKIMPVNWTTIPADWDNSEIWVEREKGQPASLKKGDITLKKPFAASVVQNDNRRDNNRGYQQQNQQRNNPERANNNNIMAANKSAKSPYNFVPLNDTVVYPDEQIVSFDKYDSKRNTGYINLEIKNLTNLMISKGADSNKIHDFLKIGKDNKPIIPGSSLRGLIKKMVGILSYSKLIEGEHFDDHALFYRGVADRAFTDIYQPQFFDVNNNFDYKVKAGYLIKNGSNYHIKPALSDPNAGQYYKIRNTAYTIRTDYVTKKPIFKFGNIEFKEYDIREIYFRPSNKQLHEHTRYNSRTRNDVSYNLRYALVTEFSFTQNPSSSLTKGTLVISGGMGRKKHDQWIVNTAAANQEAVPIPTRVVKDYKDDSQRDEEFDLLAAQKRYSSVPCFYLTGDNGEVTSFGHTPLYRIKHSKSIKDAIHQVTDDEKLDFEQLIFGNTVNFASRVFFEDAIIENIQNVQMDKTLIKILASPKDTSHQLYLTQHNLPLINWSSDEIKVSGTKEYWNKNVNSNYWKDNAIQPSSSHAGYIKPIKPNNTFIGRIRFENLTDKELGALLFALDLPEDCCHKIGMGKPLGLGTIRISPELELDDRRKRYSELLDTNGNWNLPQKQDIQDFKKSFSDYILSFVDKGKTNLWQTERLSQLKAMLFYDAKVCASADWLKETRYMEIEREKDENGDLFRDRFGNPKPKNEFSERSTLDTPVKILSQLKK